MSSDKSRILKAIFIPICICFLIVTIYFLIFGFPTIFPRRYYERPELNPAPVPFTDGTIDHDEVTGTCGPDWISDSYFVNRSVSDVEAYYKQEMDKYCPSINGWQVTFTTMSCWSGNDKIGTKDCRYSTCSLKSDSPSLQEDFSVMIFQIYPTETYVWQIHGISYLHSDRLNFPCGE
jgi:hypothetical protein